ncbi:hypothetical protein QE390_002656 [Siphonobacter sp. SORGH_AS 1065]|nr:hypothetical protein [Siphonobacter sp. SORGH_AS_1065]
MLLVRAGEDTSQGGRLAYGPVQRLPRISIQGYPYSTPPGLYLPFQNLSPNFTGFYLSKLQTPNSKLQTPNSKLQTPNSKLQTPNSKLQTPNSKLQTPNSKLQTAAAAAPNPKLQTLKRNRSSHDLMIRQAHFPGFVFITTQDVLDFPFFQTRTMGGYYY